MLIAVFRDRKIFDDLQPVNAIIKRACSKVTFAKENEDYDLPNNKVSCWFNPDRFWDVHLSHHYPNKSYEITKQPKWNLTVNFPNYIAMYFINLFYGNNKGIMIEDIGGGDGRLLLCLNKLGFTNLYITEKFTQLSPYLLEQMMLEGNVPYTLNAENTNPIAINLTWVGYTKEHFQESIELACFYNNPTMVREKNGKLFINYRPDSNASNVYIEMSNMRKLCTDIDQIANIYCKANKYDEFISKIKERNIIVNG